MADPIPFPQANFTFTPPPSMKSTCELPVYKDDEAILSKWKLTTVEIEEIARTGEVWLWVWGQDIPPVCIVAKSPFTPTPPDRAEGEKS